MPETLSGEQNISSTGKITLGCDLLFRILPVGSFLNFASGVEAFRAYEGIWRLVRSVLDTTQTMSYSSLVTWLFSI